MAVISGGTTLIDNGALDPAVPSGSLILLSTQTASASASISFTSGIDSTYDSYVFKFYDIHVSNDDEAFSFQANAVGGADFNETVTNTYFRAVHGEDGSSGALAYQTNADQAQGTANIVLLANIGNDNDQSGSGYLHLFNPSSTTFVKHFIASGNYSSPDNKSYNTYVAGYFNTTSAIDEIRFKMTGGNIDSGTIKMYGVG